MTEPLLSIQDLSVAFRQGGGDMLAVDRISFDVRPGETVALVGESGSGKSVSALSILRLLPYPAAHHPSGRILFKGRDLIAADEDAMRRVRGDDITMVFQEPMTSLNPLHTIDRQVGEILKLHRGLSDRQARARTLELLELVGDEEIRLVGEGHGDHDALALPARELVRICAEPAARVADADEIEQFQRAGAGVAVRHARVQFENFADLPLDRVQRVERSHRLLKHHGDVVAADFPHLILVGGDQVLALEQDAAGGVMCGRIGEKLQS